MNTSQIILAFLMVGGIGFAIYGWIGMANGRDLSPRDEGEEKLSPRKEAELERRRKAMIREGAAAEAEHRMYYGKIRTVFQQPDYQLSPRDKGDELGDRFVKIVSVLGLIVLVGGGLATFKGSKSSRSEYNSMSREELREARKLEDEQAIKNLDDMLEREKDVKWRESKIKDGN